MTTQDESKPNAQDPLDRGGSGTLTQSAMALAIGATLHVGALLVAVNAEHSPFGLGPFGAQWWWPAAVSMGALAGLLFSALGIGFVVWRIRRAVRSGVDLGTVLIYACSSPAQLTADGPGGHPGARVRVTATLLLLASGVWMVGAFGALAFLAMRGVGSPALLAWGTVLPALLLLFGYAGVSLRIHHLAGQPERTEDAATAVPTGILRLATVAPAVLILGALPGAAVGMAWMTAGMIHLQQGWSVAEQASRYAGVRALLSEGVDKLSREELGPERAGQLAHSILTAGSEIPDGVLPPDSYYPGRWAPEDTPGDMGVRQPRFWGGEVWDLVDAGLTDDQRAGLRVLAGHPASDAFSEFARARRADLAGARMPLPLPEGTLDFWDALYLPPGAGLQAGYARIAAAALHADAGDHERAVATLREVVSAGLLLTAEGTSAFESMIGVRWVEEARSGLIHQYTAAGDTAAAESVGRLSATALAAMRGRAEDPGLNASLPQWQRAIRLPEIALSGELPRGYRWELTAAIPAGTCINPRAILFGRHPEVQDFMDDARRALARYPSEEALFDVMDRGTSLGQEDLVWRLVAGILGTGEGSRGCGNFIVLAE